MATLVSLINDTFIVRWDSRLAEMQAKETAALLDTAQKKILRDTACADTAKAITQEKTLDDTQMNVVIADKLTQKTKEFASKIGRPLNRQMTLPVLQQKNLKEGRHLLAPSCTSSNKKTNTPKGKHPKSSN
jgi:hypothetical protein